ncbi:hypothetical protein ILUMI_15757, partial [Ignelater luminosus]
MSERSKRILQLAMVANIPARTAVLKHKKKFTTNIDPPLHDIDVNELDTISVMPEMHQHEIIPNEDNIQLDGISTYIIDEDSFVINLETFCEPSNNNCGDQTYEPSKLISELSSSEAADTDTVEAENKTVNEQRGEPDKENNENNTEGNAQKKLSRKRPRNE